MTIPLNSLPNVPTVAYDDIRNQIKSGDILLCSGNAIFSKLIQRATNSIWSHVGFVIWLESINRLMVLESVETIGVRTVPLSSYAKDYNGSGKGYAGDILIARHRQFNPANINQLSKYAINLFGYPYDTDEILKIAARVGMKAFGYTSQSPDIQSQRAFICSEYAYDCYESVGITIPYDMLGFIAPSDFAKDPMIDPVMLVKSENNN